MNRSPLDLPFLYEDNHVLVVEKPPGMLSQGDLSGDLDVLSLARAIIKKRDGKPGNVYLGLVHRLDRPVGGVMVLAKTSKAAGRLSRQFRERAASKIYRAVVTGKPGTPEGSLEHFLLKDKTTRVTRAVSPGTEGARRALLRYRVLESKGGLSLVEVTLVTGLPHQIRAQLAAMGHPVRGDRKYGSNENNPAGNIALFATRLTLSHPIGGEPISVQADPTRQLGWSA